MSVGSFGMYCNDKVNCQPLADDALADAVSRRMSICSKACHMGIEGLEID